MIPRRFVANSIDAQKWAREKHDHYVEEFWNGAQIIAEEISAYRIPRGSMIGDPACGWGRILVAARNAGYQTRGGDIVNRGPDGVDIFRRENFLGPPMGTARQIWRECSALVSNPPFSLLEEFVRRATALGIPIVAFIVPVRRLAPMSWAADVGLPLSRVAFLSPRPSMPTGKYIKAGGKVGGGQQDFALMVWRRGHEGPPAWGWVRRDALRDTS